MNNLKQETLKKLAAMRLPAFVAPMFLISGPELVIEACRAGIVGSFPTPNVRSTDQLEEWLKRITESLKADESSGKVSAPWAANLVVHRTNSRMQDDLDMVKKYKAPIVITALGSPASVVEEVHSYGGVVLADVNSVKYAKKAVAAGVDGLVLVCSGAGGHTGLLNNFAFVSEVRRFWDGMLLVAGGIGSGRDIRAVEVMGADFAYLGTSFIATTESLAEPEYKQMVVDCSATELVPSRAFTGVLANWMRPSIIRKGLDPDVIAKEDGKISFTGHAESETKAWKGVWSAGQGVGNITEIQPAGQVIEQLQSAYDRAVETKSQLAENRFLKAI